MLNRLSPKGFTLIELMVVISIGAILSTLGSISYRNIVQTANVDSKASEIVSALQRARAESAVRGVPVGCTFAPNGVFCITRTDNQISATAAPIDTNGDGLLEPGGEASAIITQVRFNPDVSITDLAPANGIQGTGIGTGSFYFLSDGSVIDLNSQPAGYDYTLMLGSVGNKMAFDSRLRVRSTGIVIKEL